MIRPLIPLLLLIATPSAWTQSTWYVPDDFSSIQAGINGSANGDTVIVRDGTWVENINFNGKGITLKSENGPTAAVIDGSGSGTVVTFANGEGPSSILEGFTVMNGSGSKGGGAYLYSSSPVVVDCVFRGNSANYGGGVATESIAEPMFLNCSIVDNSSQVTGGGVQCDYWSEPEFVDCLIGGNTAGSGAAGYSNGGGVYCFESAPTFLGTEISGNMARYGGGVYAVDYSFPIFTNCLVVDNEAESNGGGFAAASDAQLSAKRTTVAGNLAGGTGGGIWASYSDLAIKDCILWDNDSPGVAGIDGSTANSLTVNYCCVQGSQGQAWAGAGCIDADPLFVAGHYLRQVATGHQSDSPCVDSGVPTAPPSGTTRVDGGADTGQPDMGYHYAAGVSGPLLSVTDAVAGQAATVQVEACTPLGLVITAYSLRGGGPINTPWGTGLLTPPYVTLPAMTASSGGVAARTVSVPPTASGVQAWLQALDHASGTLSNGVSLTVQ